MNDGAPRDTLEAAVRAEHEAYQLMRSLVPELGLPLQQRAALTCRQEIAVTDYQHARDRLAAIRANTRPASPEKSLRNAHRSRPGGHAGCCVLYDL